MPLHHSRGRRAGGRVLESVDRIAVRQFWESLEVEEQLRVLRFEDLKLARRLYTLRTELLRSNLACYQCGIFDRTLRGQASMALLLDAFEFDLAGVNEPTAFITKLIFVERDNFFDLIEEELGGLLADGRPALRRSQWADLFDVTPSSWQDFLRRVLQLIELALLDAYQQHKQHEQELVSLDMPQSLSKSEDAGEEHILAALGVLGSSQSPSRRSKARKLRKKGATIAAAADAMASPQADLKEAVLPNEDAACGLEAAVASPPASDCVEDAVVIEPFQECTPESCGSSQLAEKLEDPLETSLDGTATSAGESQALSKSSSMDSMPSLPSDQDVDAAASSSNACNEVPSCNAGEIVPGEKEPMPGRVALFGPPPTITVPVTRKRITGGEPVAWSAWVCNEQFGQSAEWRWVAFEQADAAPERHLCARIRNTFLELSSPAPRAARYDRLRARSAETARERCGSSR
mmetsp:Transcript_4495/g.8161  ORF Transcript_4495/g.8161 Transcript_4495/m.8161 type:complete len:463 (+) Transcript_4495:97-1485(+)